MFNRLPGLIAVSLALQGCGFRNDANTCGGRLPHWLSPPDVGELRIINVVSIDKRSTLRWNNRAVTAPTLKLYMRRVSGMETEPQVVFKFDSSADCSLVRGIRKLMDEAPICHRDRLCGEGTGWRYYPGGKIVA